MIIGLEPPEIFSIKHKKIDNRTVGYVEMKNEEN